MESRSPYFSPLRYPGGKATLFSFFSSLIRDNGLIGHDYAEPYAGGAGLALKLLMREYVGNVHINDFDPGIYAVWHSILNNNVRFCDWLEHVKVDVETWEHYRDIQNNQKTASILELAKSTFFLNRTNVSGVVKGGIIGGFKQEGKYKIDARFNKNDLIERIRLIHHFKSRINIYNYDGLRFLKKLDNFPSNTLFYIDPPYHVKGSELYMNFFTDTDHINLVNHIKTIKSKWVVSYDNSEFIIDLYKNFKTISYDFKQSASNRIGHELLIIKEGLNYKSSINHIQNPHYVTLNSNLLNYSQIRTEQPV